MAGQEQQISELPASNFVELSTPVAVEVEALSPLPTDLGVGACQVGSLEAGKKKRTRRSRRPKVNTKKENGSSEDSLFSLTSVSRIEASFGNLCVDLSTGEVNIPEHLSAQVLPVAGSNDLDPGGKTPGRSRRQRPTNQTPENAQTRAESSAIGGSPHTPKPLFAQNSPSSTKSKRKPRSANQNGVSPRPPVEGSSPVVTPNKDSLQNRSKHQRRHTPGSAAKEEAFSDYFPEVVVETGLASKRLILGTVRINPKNFNEAYISDPDKGQDILIEGIKNRNRALEGDEVVIQLNPIEQWRGLAAKEMQKTAAVVYIRSRIHPRVAIGFLKPMADRDPDVALFCPRDSRVPRIRVPTSSCPQNFVAQHAQYEKEMFLASIVDWTNTRYAVGLVQKHIGPVGDIKAENVSILLENDLKTEPYSDIMYSYFPASPYTIPESEVAKREDLRKACIFTIDPATARDLDDAMSCKELANGNLQIGVHISDVSFFVDEGTPFDKEVSQRATSTYLVDTVYHMLPRDLCMLCSLLPGEDKLSYSVFWEIDLQGNIFGHRFTRSVINSCAQLSYEHAQEMLDNPDKKWLVDELPSIHNGYSVYDLSKVVNHLNHVAKILRSQRFEDGALRIDQPKVLLSLDKVTGLPFGFTTYVNKESHRLIEEFMLLANMTVARRIFADYPDRAFLRSHLPPHAYLMDQLKRTMESYGIHLDVASAGALQRSMKKYDGDDFTSQARMLVLYSRCSKPMARAKYFCTGGVDEDEFLHYALNVPFYTHFTSPIRRYPDVMVHRLLSASLGYRAAPSWKTAHAQAIAANCNKMKFAAKRASEQSTELYLALYIGQLGQMLETAVVIDVKDHSFDVIVCSMGITQRIYTNKLTAEVKHVHRDNVSKLDITWLPTKEVPQSTSQVIEMFVIVTVVLTKVEGHLKIESRLMRPSISGSTFVQVKI